MIKTVLKKLSGELFLIATCGVFLLTSLFVPIDSGILLSIDFKVLSSLFMLMLIGLGLERESVLDFIAVKLSILCKSEMFLALALSATSALIAMLVTNDAALLSIVPLILTIAKRGDFNPYKIITLVTISANIGSSLLPVGNPQNIFIFNRFRTSVPEFILTMLPFTIVGMIMIFVACLFLDKKVISFSQVEVSIKNPHKACIYCGLFILAICGIFRLVNLYAVAVIVTLSFFKLDRNLIKKADYSLLAIFFVFFAIVHNISQIEFLKSLASGILASSEDIIISSALLSQLISNVPVAIMTAPFISDYKPLLLGVSIGGVGTLIASLANVISYKLYTRDYPVKSYLIYFSLVNASFLLVFLILFTL